MSKFREGTWGGFTKVRSQFSPSYWTAGTIHVWRIGRKWYRAYVPFFGAAAERTREYPTRDAAFRGA